MASEPSVRVPIVDLRARAREERAELLACVERVLDDGGYVLGPEVARFERAAAEAIGAPHVVGLNSGTDALMLALWGLGVGRGDEVVTTPVSFVATVAAIAHVGARAVLVDVGPDQNLDPGRVEAAITERTRAIVPVHWAGRPADLGALGEIARRRGVALVEDAAQGIGASHQGRSVGTFGAAAAFSAHPLKLLPALGDGGFLATGDADLAQRVRLYRNHGLEDRDTCAIFGVNSRLDALHAAVLAMRLDNVAGVVAARRRNVARYRELLADAPVAPPPEDRSGDASAWTFFNVRAARRDALREHLAARGVETLVYYGTALHLHPAAKALGYARGDFPVAERQCAEVLALPVHEHLDEAQIAYVAEQVRAFPAG